MSLRFVLCDTFGVDENDLYFYGLILFWILPTIGGLHGRGRTR
jgi:hypothetical protein